MTDYKKIAKKITNKFSQKEYNRFITIDEVRDKRDYMMIFHGMRLGKLLVQQEANERLQKEIPISGDEYNYYQNL